MPCLQICIDAEGYKQDVAVKSGNENLDISIKFESHKNTKVDFSSGGHDESPECLLNSSRG